MTDENKKDLFQNRYRRIRAVLIYVLIANILVALGKGVIGWMSGSIAMVADAFHSLMDGSSNIIGLVGIYLAARPRDKSHSYGHAKFETFASIGIVILLIVTAFQIGESVVARLTAEAPAEPDIGTLAFLVMGITIVVNIFVSVYERRQGKKLESTFLTADSRHTLSDVGVSSSVIAGLIAVRLGYPQIDAIVGGAIAVIIAYAALKIMKEASYILLDRAALDPAQVEAVCMSLKVAGIQGCHRIRTRGSESGYWIDLHIVVDPEMTTRESHKIASDIERRLKDFFGRNTDTVVHIEPGKPTGKAD
jgi:cation diffusion facilitator family transporter